MATMTSNPTTVQLTSEQRDGLREYVSVRLPDDFALRDRDGEWESIRADVEILGDCVAILDQIGWEHRREGVCSLDVDAPVRRQLAALRRLIEDALDDHYEPEDQHLVRLDRAALEAVAVIESACAADGAAELEAPVPSCLHVGAGR